MVDTFSLSLTVLWLSLTLFFMAVPASLFCGGSVSSFSLWWFYASPSLFFFAVVPLSSLPGPVPTFFAVVVTLLLLFVVLLAVFLV